MSFPIFPVTPDLEIVEAFEWMTDVYETWAGKEQRVKIRDQFRRFYEFSFKMVLADKPVLDAALFGNLYQSTTGVPTRLKWTLPIWNDLQVLAANLAAGSATIPVTTTGYDFHAGGLAVIIARSAIRDSERFRAVRNDEWEIVTIDSLNATTLTLNGVTADAWTAGDLILPARQAWLDRPIEMLDLSNDARAYRGVAAFQCEIEI